MNTGVKRKAKIDSYLNKRPPKRQRTIKISNNEKRLILMNQKIIYQEMAHLKTEERLQKQLESQNNELILLKNLNTTLQQHQLNLQGYHLELQQRHLNLIQQYNDQYRQLQRRDIEFDREIGKNKQNNREQLELLNKFRIILADSQKEILEAKMQIEQLQEKIEKSNGKQ